MTMLKINKHILKKEQEISLELKSVCHYLMKNIQNNGSHINTRLNCR